MFSSQTLHKSSKGEYNNAYGLFLEQIVSHHPQSTVDSLKTQRRLASTTQSSDRDLSIGGRTCSERDREQMVRATLYSRLAGYPYEPTHGLTGLENANESESSSRSEHNMSSHGSTAIPAEMLAVEPRNRTPKTPPKPICKLSGLVASFQPRYPKGTVRGSLTSNYNSLSHTSKAGSANDAGLAATACRDFQEHMLRIPAEICQLIMDMMFEEAFGPRRVHPHSDPSIMNIFLALDKHFYRKFHEQYWTKNTWVISKGPLNKTMRFMTEKPYNDTTTEFSLQTPNKAALRIQSVELSFSNADTTDLNEWYYHLAQQSATDPYITPSRFSHTIQSPNNESQAPQFFQRDIARAQRYDETQDELIQTWQDKFDRVAMLNLRNLVLDFTEAYDPGGMFLGVNLVRRLIPFAYGMPANFKILAPDIWIEGQIRDAFQRLNAG